MLLKFTVSSVYPLWLSIFCLVFGLGISLYLYQRKGSIKEVSSLTRNILIFLRSAYLSILSFLLISPFILDLEPIVEKAILIIAQDNSESISEVNDSIRLNNYLSEIKGFEDKCADDFEIHRYNFGESLEFNPEKADFKDRLTDISAMLDGIRDKYENRNVSLVLMASDGLYNRGQNPLYLSQPLPFPLYTLAMGDTSKRKDLWINDVNHNKLSFLGNSFEVNVEVRASLLSGQKSQLLIKRNGLVKAAKEIRIEKDDYLVNLNFQIPAEEIGLIRYEVQVKNIEGEISITNNTRYFYIEILEGRQEILILTASPHPDVSALMNSINSGKNYKATSSSIQKFNGNFDDYDLVILNQLPTSKRGRGNLDKNIGDVPKLYILGKNTNYIGFNDLNTGLTLNNFKGQFNESTAEINKDFSFFSLHIDDASIISKFPPLITPFANYMSTSTLNTLYYQKIGRVETQFPLIAFSEKDGLKSGIISGEGLWRWKLYEYRLHGNTELFDELMQKIVQYLSLREDKSRFRVASEASYYENNDVVIRAEFYDKAYELNNELPAGFSLRNEEDQVFDFNFLKFNDIYQVDLGKLDIGEYTWSASISDGAENFKKTGAFSIKALQLEKNNLEADHSLLYNVSAKHGGRLLYPKDLSAFADEIMDDQRFKPLLHYNERLKELISFAWLFALLLIFLSVEWFMRKWHGLN